MLSKLKGITTTLTQQVDSDAIAAVFESFPVTGDTTGLYLNPTYRMYCDLFAKAARTNELKTPIYTLSFDSATNHFYGGIASNGPQTYGWYYVSPPDKLYQVYRSGGVIGQFEDDHGTWLSAVAPLKTSNGNVFAVIEADYPFDSFMEEARNELVNSVFISFIVMIMVISITYPALRQILKEEELSKQQLEMASAIIREKNSEIKSSLEYASTIQEKVLPTDPEMCSFFRESFVFNKPKDIVSGDFYWFYPLTETQALVAVADCTGHGVPGALMSIMGHSYLNEIVLQDNWKSPADILEQLNEKIYETFLSDNAERKEGTDGMDIGLCLIDKQRGKILFSGARRPLAVISDAEIDLIDGTKRGIGEHYLTSEIAFENHEIELKTDSMYFLFSDGLQDQFGGDSGKKLMKKRVNEWLKDLSETPSELRCEWLDTRLAEWKGNNQQVDDICLLGFSV